jgi:IS30 family transposase
MIRTLLKTGMSLRKIASTLKISHGSVSLEKALLKKEEAEYRETQRVKEQAEQARMPQVVDEAAPW